MSTSAVTDPAPDGTWVADWSAPGRDEESGRRSRLLLAGLMLLMGTLHFVVPKAFVRLIPGWLGDQRFWVYASGVAELTSGALLLSPRTKRVGGFAAAATIVGVFPGNIKMAFDAGPPKTAAGWLAWLRLPWQAPLVWWALTQTRP
jgi:uncharacterized membrane protein